MKKLTDEKHLGGDDPVKNQEKSLGDTPAEEIEDNRESENDFETESSSESESDSDSDSDNEFDCKKCNRKISGYEAYKRHLKGKKHAKAVKRRRREKKLIKKDGIIESDEENLVQELFDECKICNKEFYGPESYGQHLKSKKHKQKSFEASILKQIEEDGEINTDKLKELYKKKRITDDALEESKEKLKLLNMVDEDETQHGEFECKECEKQFSGLKPYAQHLLSKVHAKNIEKKNLLHKVIPETSKGDEGSMKLKEYDLNTLCVDDGIIVCKVCSTSFSGPENATAHIKSKKHLKNFEKYIRKLKKKKEKKSKEIDLSSVVEKEEQPETENNFQPPAEASVESGVLDSSKKKASKTSDLGIQAKEELIKYEKYKEYKKLMNSLQEDDKLK